MRSARSASALLLFDDRLLELDELVELDVLTFTDGISDVTAC